MKVGDLITNKEDSIGLVLGVGKHMFGDGWFESLHERNRHDNSSGFMVRVIINGQQQEWVCNLRHHEPSKPVKALISEGR